MATNYAKKQNENKTSSFPNIDINTSSIDFRSEAAKKSNQEFAAIAKDAITDKIHDTDYGYSPPTGRSLEITQAIAKLQNMSKEEAYNQDYERGSVEGSIEEQVAKLQYELKNQPKENQEKFDGDIQNIIEAGGTDEEIKRKMYFANEYRKLDDNTNKEVREYLEKNPKDYAGARKIRKKYSAKLDNFNYRAGSPFSD